MMINYRNKTRVFCSLLAVMLISAFNACKKYENPAQVYEAYGADVNGKAARKVLIININGAVGEDVKAINPTNIAALLKNGKFSFNELKDGVFTDAGSTASMLTGVSSSKHRIVDDSYIPLRDLDDDHAPIINFPSLFSRMMDIRPEFKTVTITSDAPLDKYLIHAGQSILAQNDAFVKDSAVNILKDNNARVVMVDFRSVKAAGSKDGFSPDVPSYKAAIETVDGYIGEMMAALKGRKDYALEDWLVIVTTNRGGDERNAKPGFIICANPNLKEQAISKEGFNTMHFKGTATNAYIKDDKGLYDSGADKDFTVQLQIKMNGNNSYPGFLSKSDGVRGGTTTGWTMFQEGARYGVIFGGSSNGGEGKTQVLGGTIFDGKWHTITMTVKLSAGVRTATLYTDGVKDGTLDITTRKSLSTKEPFMLGHKNVDNSGNLDLYAADMLYFNVALDAEVIRNNVVLKDISKHPNYANLIGYWPIDEGGGGVLINSISTGYNFLMRGSGSWDALGNDIPATRTPQTLTDGTLSIVATGPDVAALTYYWLRVPVKSDWSLDGTPWITYFEIEYIK